MKLSRRNRALLLGLSTFLVGACKPIGTPGIPKAAYSFVDYSGPSVTAILTEDHAIENPDSVLALRTGCLIVLAENLRGVTTDNQEIPIALPKRSYVNLCEAAYRGNSASRIFGVKITNSPPLRGLVWDVAIGSQARAGFVLGPSGVLCDLPRQAMSIQMSLQQADGTETQRLVTPAGDSFGDVGDGACGQGN